MYYAYILLCADTSLYTGSTNNLEKRLYQHNESRAGARYTKIRRPVFLVYAQRCKTLHCARSLEAEIKKLSRKDKLALIHLKGL